MNQLFIFTLLTTYTVAYAWVSTSNNIHTRTTLYSSPDSKNPKWQDCYDGEDDDCLSTTYSAAFVAEEWIKSMPCGKVSGFSFIDVSFMYYAQFHPSLFVLNCSLYCHNGRTPTACPKTYLIQELWVMQVSRKLTSWNT